MAKKYLEEFGVSGLGAPGDVGKINQAIAWSNENRKPVYGENIYWIKDGNLVFPPKSSLILSPGARMVRRYGQPQPGGLDFLARTFEDPDSVDQPGIYLEGGIWGPDDPTEVPPVDMISMTFTRINTNSGTITFNEGTNPFTDLTNYPGTQYILVWGPSPYVPYTGFFIKSVDGNTLTVQPSPLPQNTPPRTATGMSAVATVPAGPNFKFFSSSGVATKMDLVQPRGIQYRLSGDNFLLSYCRSRQVPLDGGAAVILKQGRLIRCEHLDMEASDDCFIFSPDPGTADAPVVLEEAAIVDSVCSTSSGIAAFLTSGDAIQPEVYYGQMRGCYARGILGRFLEDRLRYGKHAVKFHNASGAYPMEDCWLEDFVIDQSTSTETAGVAVRALVGRGPSRVSFPP